jgi:hypothetical protein
MILPKTQLQSSQACDGDKLSPNWSLSALPRWEEDFREPLLVRRLIAFTEQDRKRNIGTGLLLGGGLSYLSARHGFSVDALVEADVVLVNGEMVTATAKNQYSDLFKALKVG